MSEEVHSDAVLAADIAAAAGPVDDAAAAAASVEVDADVSLAEDDDAAIEELRARVRAMEEEQAAEEAKRMDELSGAGPTGFAPSKPSATAAAVSTEQSDQDSRSIHVAQVDYSVTEEELKHLFEACGPVVRATILKDKFSGQPKGFAYIEFESADSINNAMILNETEFKGRTLKVGGQKGQREQLVLTKVEQQRSHCRLRFT